MKTMNGICSELGARVGPFLGDPQAVMFTVLPSVLKRGQFWK